MKQVRLLLEGVVISQSRMLGILGKTREVIRPGEYMIHKRLCLIYIERYRTDENSSNI